VVGLTTTNSTATTTLQW